MNSNSQYYCRWRNPKIYKNSRRRNHSYREHYGADQEEYRKWKISLLDKILYLTPKSHCVRSASHPLFTTLYPHFYALDGKKQIPLSLVKSCILPHFLAILFMDDGSLSISHRINLPKKLIYLTPHIYLYLQCYSLKELTFLSNHISKNFSLVFNISTRNDGYGYILKTTSVKETYRFLDIISPVSKSCESMYYKTSWEYRFAKEKRKWLSTLPGYSLLASSSERSKPYSDSEITSLIELKKMGCTTQKIADTLKRSYWSVTANWRDINK